MFSLVSFDVLSIAETFFHVVNHFFCRYNLPHLDLPLYATKINVMRQKNYHNKETHQNSRLEASLVLTTHETKQIKQQNTLQLMQAVAVAPTLLCLSLSSKCPENSVLMHYSLLDKPARALSPNLNPPKKR